MGNTPEQVIASIRRAFAHTEYPGDAFLQGSYDGCEPAEEITHFVGRRAWADLTPDFLDQRYCALSFFSEAGFRFFLPAYLVADLGDRLFTADPVFHLTHGFSDHSLSEEHDGRTVVRRWGRSQPLNPRRYGAATWYDHARYRLSVFTREEAGAVVDYLGWRRDAEAANEEERKSITAALDSFWLERARLAPTAEDLGRRVAEEAEEYRRLTGS